VEPDQLTYTQTSYLPGSECFFFSRGEMVLLGHTSDTGSSGACPQFNEGIYLSRGQIRNAREILVGLGLRSLRGISALHPPLWHFAN
jgi:hypothetical protein